MEFLKSITDLQVKGFFAFMIIASVIVGFFMKIITSDVFMGVAGSVITYYYKDKESAQLQTQVDKKDEQIKALQVGIPEVKDLNDGKSS